MLSESEVRNAHRALLQMWEEEKNKNAKLQQKVHELEEEMRLLKQSRDALRVAYDLKVKQNAGLQQRVRELEEKPLKGDERC